MATSQPVRIKTPLAADDLLFHSMEGTEELGRAFLYELDLLSPKDDLSLDELLGQEACVELDLPSGGTRYFHGHVTQVAQTGRRGRYIVYTAQLRPWLWFLTRTADCRIFQQKTVPDIIKDVFREHGFSDFKDSLSGTYRTWEYCVQFRETDFNFVSRLMEQEGIYYFFLHENGKHTLVLADSYGAHAPLDGYSEIAFHSRPDVVDVEHVYEWRHGKSVQSGKYVMTDYNFQMPKASLEVNAVISRRHAQAEYELFDYPGEYAQKSEGDTYVRARLEEIEAQHERVHGVCNARGVCAGGLFSLTDFPRQDQNREYLVVASRTSVVVGDYETGGGEGLQFDCSFEAIDGRTPYRSARVTPKPTTQGPQTAVVVGPAGEEIWTDEYGRIKVQFHWDRYGKADENSSCWVRVAQVWAGGNWGGMQIPRIGHEVVVDFIDGDPDRPLVTGRVYNAANMPPYSLPDDKTQSGLKSRSSKSGSADNFNEIRFEDKKGAEEIYVHAEKDMHRVVENIDVLRVGFPTLDEGSSGAASPADGSQSIVIRYDRTENVGRNETITIGANRTEQVGNDETISIGANRSETVGKDESISIGQNRSENVGGDETISIAGNRREDVGKNESVTIADDSDESVGKNRSVSVGKDGSMQIGGKYVLDVGKELLIEAGDSITLKTGSASIVLKKDGKITIKGKDIAVTGSGKIDVKASSDVTIKGSKIKQN